MGNPRGRWGSDRGALSPSRALPLRGTGHAERASSGAAAGALPAAAPGAQSSPGGGGGRKYDASASYYCRHCGEVVAVHGHSLSLRPTFFCSRCPSKDNKPRRCNQAFVRPKSEGGELVSIFTVIASVPGPGEAGNPANIEAPRPSAAAGANGGVLTATTGSKRPFKALCMLAEAGKQLEDGKRNRSGNKKNKKKKKPEAGAATAAAAAAMATATAAAVAAAAAGAGVFSKQAHAGVKSEPGSVAPKRSHKKKKVAAASEKGPASPGAATQAAALAASVAPGLAAGMPLPFELQLQLQQQASRQTNLHGMLAAQGAAGGPPPFMLQALAASGMMPQSFSAGLPPGMALTLPPAAAAAAAATAAAAAAGAGAGAPAGLTPAGALASADWHAMAALGGMPLPGGQPQPQVVLQGVPHF